MSEDPVDHSRRRLLTAASVGFGAVGAVFAAVPFISSWQPSARARALGAPVAVDASKLEEGQMLKVVWRGQPVFVVRRSKAVVAGLGFLALRPLAPDLVALGGHDPAVQAAEIAYFQPLCFAALPMLVTASVNSFSWPAACAKPASVSSRFTTAAGTCTARSPRA